ncbi:MAG: hypothetical protein QNK04_30660 [Myxococcota bacterium]|nr:hypothetical protein [Myxococcota bacterium]
MLKTLQRKLLLLTALPAAAALLLAGPAFGQGFPVFVVHALPGGDLSVPAPDELPVDVAVVGDAVDVCITDVRFGDVVSAELPVGGYAVRVSSAETMGCTGADFIFGSFDVSVGTTTLVVAHLDPAMNATLSQFSQKGAILEDGESILSAVHAAAAPTVDVRARRVRRPYDDDDDDDYDDDDYDDDDYDDDGHHDDDDGESDDDDDDSGKSRGTVRFEDLRNGDQSGSAQIESGTYKIDVKPAQGGSPVLKGDFFIDGNVTLVAAGSLETGSFTVVPVVFGDGIFEPADGEPDPYDDDDDDRGMGSDGDKDSDDDDESSSGDGDSGVGGSEDDDDDSSSDGDSGVGGSEDDDDESSDGNGNSSAGGSEDDDDDDRGSESSADDDDDDDRGSESSSDDDDDDGPLSLFDRFRNQGLRGLLGR